MSQTELNQFNCVSYAKPSITFNKLNRTNHSKVNEPHAGVEKQWASFNYPDRGVTLVRGQLPPPVSLRLSWLVSCVFSSCREWAGERRPSKQRCPCKLPAAMGLLSGFLVLSDCGKSQKTRQDLTGPFFQRPTHGVRHFLARFQGSTLNYWCANPKKKSKTVM